MIFKLVLDVFFANAKTICVFLDTDSKLMLKIVDASNFFTSSQDFHIEFVKSVIDLKNS